MKIIEPSYYILRRKHMGPLECIESAARLAYKSENKITEDSAKPFCDMLLKREHYPVFEFANLHFKFNGFISFEDAKNITYQQHVLDFAMITRSFPHLNVTEKLEITHNIGLQKVVYISGTVRAFAEALNKPLSVAAQHSSNLIWSTFVDFYHKYAEEHGLPAGIPKKTDYWPTWYNKIEFKALRVGEVLRDLDIHEQERHLMVPVHFICSRAISHELVRHRPCSFIQQSQRYCNYSYERFGREVTFIKPSAFFPDNSPEYAIWEKSMQAAESAYMEMLDKGCTPQAARNVLPNSCATEIIVYATLKEWKHILSLRTNPAADPAMRQLMLPLNQKLFFALDCFE